MVVGYHGHRPPNYGNNKGVIQEGESVLNMTINAQQVILNAYMCINIQITFSSWYFNCHYSEKVFMLRSCFPMRKELMLQTKCSNLAGALVLIIQTQRFNQRHNASCRFFNPSCSIGKNDKISRAIVQHRGINSFLIFFKYELVQYSNDRQGYFRNENNFLGIFLAYK